MLNVHLIVKLKAKNKHSPIEQLASGSFQNYRGFQWFL